MRKAASLTTSDLKAEARQWRADQAEAGHPVTHSQALEMVARFHGFRDWNTASGVLPVTRGPRYGIGQRVTGRYLKQPFTGTVIAVAALGAGDFTRITVRFDAPVDVVAFESFSAMRHRVEATVDRDGISPAKTSDGVPHMVLETIG